MPEPAQRFDLRVITANDTLPLRQQVLWPDKPVAHVMVENDAQAIHIGAFSQNALVGVGSFYTTEKSVRLRKLAVSEKMQGMGLGTRIVQFGAMKMKSEGFATLWCDARVTALKFYQNLGFEIDDRIFDKSGVSYQKATLDLTALNAK